MRVSAPATKFPAKPIQSEAAMASPPTIETGKSTTIKVPSTKASEISQRGEPGQIAHAIDHPRS
jgi:hypothetical protein